MSHCRSIGINTYELSTPYSKETVELTRQLPGRRWDGNVNVFVTRTINEARRAAEILAQIGVPIPSELIAQIQAAADATRRKVSLATNVSKVLEERGLKLFAFQEGGVAWLLLRRSALLLDEMGLGKQQPVSEPILTPNGWIPIGSISVGDMVIGRDGKPTRVVGVHPQRERRNYRVTFSDGSWTRCGPDHLWTVHDKLVGRRYRTMPTLSLIEAGLRDSTGNRKWHVPLVEPIRLRKQDLEYDPYLIGVALGDGNWQRNGRVVLCTDKEILDAIDADDIKPHETSEITGYGVVWLKGFEGGERSHKKFVPERYLFSDVADRVALLRGLLDTDGHPMYKGGVEFSSTSPALTNAVAWLVESLGGVVRGRRSRIPSFTYKGEKRTGKRSERINLKLPAKICPFRLKRKKDRWVRPTKYPPARLIDSIEPVDDEDSVCISISNPDGLYVTRHCILTHNTIQSLMAIPERQASMVVCPASLKLNWKKEALKWRPDLCPIVLSGRGSFRLPRPGELVITNYELLPGLGTPKDPGPGLPFVDYPIALIGDEVHLLKNYKTKRTTRFSKLCSKVLFAEGTAWGLTGTPLLNRPPELFSILCVFNLVRESFGNFDEFKRLFRAASGEYGLHWRGPTRQTTKLIHKAMDNVSLRRERKSVLPDLPTKLRKFQDVAIDAKFRRQIDEWCKKKGIDASEIRKSLATKPEFEKYSWLRKTLAKAKIPRLLEIVQDYEDSEESLVVFCAHRAPVEALGERAGWAVVHGEISQKKRDVAIEKFQAGKLKGIAVTIRAGGVGVTLTHAAHAVFVDMDWVPGANQQAEDRLCRIGARGANYTYLVADHAMDEAVCEVLAEKEELIEVVVVETSDKSEYTEKAVAEAEAKASALEGLAEKFTNAAEQQKKEEERKLKSGEGIRCPRCDAFLEWRTAGPNARYPGRVYAKCSCKYFRWRD